MLKEDFQGKVNSDMLRVLRLSARASAIAFHLPLIQVRLYIS